MAVRVRLHMLVGILALGLAAGLVAAQRGGGGGGRGGRGGFGGGGGGFGGGGMRGGRMPDYTAGNEPFMPLPADRIGVPKWDVDTHFKGDQFTFVRLRFTNGPGARSRRPGAGTGRSWLNDWPASDLDLSFRLQQLTSLKVNPEPIQLAITDDKLLDYPFAYLIQVGSLEFTDEEVKALRKYLLNGGFVMVDDYWGLDAQQNWREQISRVLPDRPVTELPLDHPIFHCVFDLKQKPQVETIQLWQPSAQAGAGGRRRSPDDPDVHYRAITDDKGRIMVLECANTDLGDGWEREGENEEYFHQMSEKLAYPMAVNIVFYAMTH